MMYQRILVPLDGSPVAEAALEVASQMLEPNGGELVLVRMQEQSDESWPPDLPAVAEAYDSERIRCESYLQIVRDRWQTPGRPVQIELLQHDQKTALMLSEAAERLDCQLVVMTSHGRSGFLRRWSGSVAEELARCSPRPVVILGPQTPEVCKIKQEIREMSSR